MEGAGRDERSPPAQDTSRGRAGEAGPGPGFRRSPPSGPQTSTPSDGRVSREHPIPGSRTCPHLCAPGGDVQAGSPEGPGEGRPARRPQESASIQFSKHVPGTPGKEGLARRARRPVSPYPRPPRTPGAPPRAPQDPRTLGPPLPPTLRAPSTLHSGATPSPQVPPLAPRAPRTPPPPRPCTQGPLHHPPHPSPPTRAGGSSLPWAQGTQTVSPESPAF